MDILFRGAESIIYIKDDILYKERLSKKYRIEELDSKIIKQRTKKEVNILKKLNALKIPAPLFKKCEGNIIQMEYIKGKTIKEVCNNISENPSLDIYDLFYKIGFLVNTLHNNNIIHGDLTTSNFIYNDKIYIIDFGLSHISKKPEDKAVDIFVFEKAIGCVHDEKYITSFYAGYVSGGNSEEVMKRLDLVKKRGRKHELC